MDQIKTLKVIEATSRLVMYISLEEAERLLRQWDEESQYQTHTVWWHRSYLRAFIEYRRALDKLDKEN